MKIDCIITWWGRLVEKSGRAWSDKWAELIAWISTWERVLNVLQETPYFDTIVYAGALPSMEPKKADRVIFTQAGPEKHFFWTIKNGVEKLKKSSNHILVVASDLPLIDVKSVKDMIQEWQRAGGTMLTTFSCSNEQVQQKYPWYNPNKRFIQMQDGTMIFGNAFMMSRELFQMLEKLFLEIDSSEKRNLGTYLWFYRMLGIKWICKLLSIIPFANIKNTQAISRLLQTAFSPPLQKDFEWIADHILGQDNSTKILKCAPEFTVDFDRYH